MKLSVVIPVYNAEQYLAHCLDSIFSIDIDECLFEVICVNDGSTDNSQRVLCKYAELHSNLILIEQENQGVSAARNSGLDVARGSYVVFVDADDIIPLGSLQKLFADLELAEEADLVICNMLRNGSRAYDWRGVFAERKLYQPTELLNGGLLRGSVCGTYFKTSFLNRHNIRFLSGMRNGEDTLFMLTVMYYADKIRFADIDLYEVNCREGSASRSFGRERIDVMIRSVERVSMVRREMLGGKGHRMVLDYMMYIVLLNLVKDTFKTPLVGYCYLRRNGVARYAKFELSADTHFLRNKMELINKSFFAFYFVRRLKVALSTILHKFKVL